MIKFKTESIVGIFVFVTVAIFFYITFKIGALNFDRGNYRTYYVSFVSSSGLNRKDEVKIAGVKVGWIDDISLIKQRKYTVRAKVKILSDCILLHSDAYAVIRQDGLLGRKYLEIVPGTPSFEVLTPGSEIICREDPSTSIDKIFCDAHNIASDIGQVTSSIKNSVNSQEWQDMMQKTTHQINEIVNSLANVTQAINNIVKENREIICTTTNNLSTIVSDLKDQLPKIVADVKCLSGKLSEQVAPTMQKGIEDVALTIDKNLSRVADKFEKAGDQIEEVAKKINDGHGTLGKFINDDKVYKDVNVTVKCAGDFVSRIRNMGLGFYAEFEGLPRFGKKKEITHDDTDYKFYLNGFLQPTPDTLFLAGIVARNDGRVFHKDIFEKNSLIKRQEIREFDRWLWNLQFGKAFGENFWLRAGFFESTPGVGVDFCLPLKNDIFKWIMTLEVYDFKGHLRIADDSPHLRWINRLFLHRNFYLMLGLDDFVSKRTKHVSLGAGLCFNFGCGK